MFRCLIQNILAPPKPGETKERKLGGKEERGREKKKIKKMNQGKKERKKEIRAKEKIKIRGK
jgi:hypothetical protein